MSVGIVVKVSEGLVLGADSAATIRGRVERPEGVAEGVLKTYFNARKLLQIGDFPIGVLTWGAAFIGSRTVESLVREWEYDKHWQNRKDYSGHNDNESFRVESCARELGKHISKVYTNEFRNTAVDSRPVIGFVVAGYSYRGFFPETWRFVLPIDKSGHIHNLRPDIDGKPDFGASWFGLTDAIVRLHFGRDDRVIKLISDKFGLQASEVHNVLEPLQYQIPFAVMPLQDAIEYAKYMLTVTVGRYRFVVGPELCGGQVDIAAVTQKRFDWISQKTWSLD